MFPLVRYFSLVSAAIVGLAMIAVTIILTQTTKEQLVEERQNANVNLTRIFSSSIWNEFRGHVKSSASLGGVALRVHPQTDLLQQKIRLLMNGLSVVKVKVYSLNGNTVFSTEVSQMGDNKNGNPGFLSARDGLATSEYSNRAKFSAFENEIFDVDVVSSYIPIWDQNNHVEAVFEVYDNVTATLHHMDRRRNFIIAVVAGLFALLYLTLLMVVRRAAKILAQQHGQIAKAKSDLEVAQETLVQKERLATLGQLTATVSHELRNPLASIRSSVHLAIQKTKGKELGIDRSLERAERNVVRCDAIISDLLGYASEPSCDSEQFAGDEWLRATLDELIVPDHVEVVKRLLGSDAILHAIPDQIRQVVINVSENAFQALSDARPAKTPMLTIRTGIESERYNVVFEDNGPGMDTEDLAKVFEPLFSTKSYGCGLGLATAKKIIEKHDGAIRLESDIGVGTKVTLSLPMKRPQKRAA